jgi:hypothetical protein
MTESTDGGLSTAARRVLRAVARRDAGVPLSGPHGHADDFRAGLEELREKDRVRLVAGVDGLTVIRLSE